MLEGCNSNTDSSLRRTCKPSILARILAQCAHAFANEYSPIVRHATASPEAGAKRQAWKKITFGLSAPLHPSFFLYGSTDPVYIHLLALLFLNPVHEKR